MATDALDAEPIMQLADPPSRPGIYDHRKSCQQWLSHFAQELIIGQLIQRLHLHLEQGRRGTGTFPRTMAGAGSMGPIRLV
jgi:hypothetical protein